MRFGPASKFSFSISLAILAFLLPWYISLSSIPFIILLERFTTPFRPISIPAHRTFLRLILYLSALGLVIVCMNGLLIAGDGRILQIWRLNLSWEGIEFGLNVSGRLVLLSIAIFLFFVSTPIKEFADFLGHIGLPGKVVTIILLTTFYLEQLPTRIKQIFWAPEARGAPIRANIALRIRSFFSILAPLTLASLVESIERGMALELRGFHGDITLSRLQDSRDFKMAFLILLASLGAILWLVIWK